MGNTDMPCNGTREQVGGGKISRLSEEIERTLISEMSLGEVTKGQEGVA